MRKTPYLILAAASLGLLSGCSSGTSLTYPVFPAEQTTRVNESFDNGYIFDNGITVPRDYAKAIHFYSKAVKEKKDARAMNNLGVMAIQGRGSEVSSKKALAHFRDAAGHGSAAAHYNIGLMYDVGAGVGRSMNSAVAEYRMAAEMGHADSQFRLAQILESGDGVRADPNEATRLSEMAAVRGNADAQRRLNILTSANGLTPAVSELFAIERCNNCSTESERKMAGRQATGLQDLADDGDAVAQYNLGVHYLQGNGAVLDPSEAARLFTLSARQGYAAAERQLGQMHLRGQAVAKSKVLGHAWLNLASQDTGSEGSAARAEMESLEVSMTAAEIKQAQNIAFSGSLKGR